jgi:O-antigen ligase
MEMTPIGWVLLPLACISYLFAPQILYPLAIFFLPFSATAVVNVGTTDSASGVLASMLFGAVWMARELPAMRQMRSRSNRQGLRKPMLHLGLFLLVVVLSLLMPLWINGHFVVENPELGAGSDPLQFTGKHVTQTIYLLYGILFTIFVALKNSDSRELVRSIKIFIISSIFVSLWGFFQFACGMLNIDYPAFIFNSSKTESAEGYLQVVKGSGLSRISSVATEPSMFAQCMLISTVLALFMLLSPRPLLSRMWDRLAVAIIVGALLISTSTTAYLGLVGVLILYALALVYLRKFRARYLLPGLALAGVLGVAYAMIFPITEVFQTMILEKGDSYSALARLNSVLLARDYFLQYPILGLGWGSVTSHDLIFKLLSNTGILGLAAFMLFVGTVFVRLWRSARRGPSSQTGKMMWSLCLLLSLVVLVLASVAGDFAFTYGHVWFVFGIAMCVPVLNRSAKTVNASGHDFSPQTGGDR